MPHALFSTVLTASALMMFGDLAAAQEANSPELEFLKTLEGRWEGTTTPGDPRAVVTYSVTGRGTAVVEMLYFPATGVEMMTVYHDDHNGQLAMTHYCSAGNQPYLSIVRSSDNQLDFELSPDDRTIDVENEWHAHGLTITVNDNGTLVHDWRYWNDGQRDGGRYIESVRAE